MRLRVGDTGLGVLGLQLQGAGLDLDRLKRAAHLQVISVRTSVEAFTEMCSTSTGLKPSFSTRTLYSPTGRLGAVKSPASPEITVSETFVAVLLTVIFTAGMTAPELS